MQKNLGRLHAQIQLVPLRAMIHKPTLLRKVTPLASHLLSTGSPAPASTQPPTSPAKIATDSSPTDSTGSVCPPQCKVLSRFQCEHCRMKLSSRKCLYKHTQRKHKTTDEVEKAEGSKHVICPECKETETRKAFATTSDLIWHLNNHHGRDYIRDSMFGSLTVFPTGYKRSNAFSRPDPKLLCSWHVDRSWRRKLNEHLKCKELMAEVYPALKSLQNDLSETSFRRCLQHFMAWIKSKSEPLAKYFEKEYAGRTRERAACFRVRSRTNTNMFVERLHRTLKEL